MAARLHLPPKPLRVPVLRRATLLSVHDGSGLPARRWG